MKQQLVIVFALLVSFFMQPSTGYAAFPVMETAPVAAEQTGFREKVQDAIKQYSTPAPAESRRNKDDGWMGITSLALGLAGGAMMLAALNQHLYRACLHWVCLLPSWLLFLELWDLRARERG